MSPIDLVVFAEHSQKLPSQILAPEFKTDEPDTFKVLSSHLMDYFMVLAMMGMTSAFLYSGVKFFLVTNQLQHAFPQHAVQTFSAPLVPFFIFNYFFFSYFLNHGQSWGMLMMKKRMMVEDKSFKSAFKWAAHSTLLCLSCGLYYVFSGKVWKNMKDHDHLYDDLMTHKDFSHIDLVSEIEKWSTEEAETEVHWQEAA